MGRIRSRCAAVCAAVVLTVPAVLAIDTHPAVAASGISLVQKGTEATGGGATVVATLPAGSTAGDLLLATTMDLNSGCASDNYTAPAGWVKATSICRGSTGPLTLWYLANASAGITTVTFNTGSSGANSTAQLSEWSGVATSNPLDGVGSFYSSASATALTVSTSGSIATSGELAVTAFQTSSGLSSFTAGSGWTNVRSDPGNGYDSDYRVSPPTGSAASETVTSNPQTNWAAVIATFRPGCAGGSSTIKTPSAISFPGATLNGYNRTVSQTAVVTIDDETGSGSGWNVTATSTTLSTGGGNVLPNSATVVTAATVSADAGNCSLPTNTTTYPVTLPAGSTPPTAARVYDATANTGQGPSDVTITSVISVPANSAAGSYNSTWTLTIGSGP